ncbi:MAG: FHA domain-containing protein [Anaerolineae bacterium]|uniref:FHA domain-containing protein n=1 Tax=Candidatus Amarolinea dominans TaxID=3140696 RepID=UPI00313688C0|nr:FHA domain-containing protein [Anaerolineae bacterium]
MLPQLAVAPVAGPGLAAQLRAEQGPLAGQTFAISHSPFTLGRSPENDLVLPEPLASRQHVRLEARAGRWYVIDLDSANGTLLNRQRLSGEMALNAGDLMAHWRHRVRLRRRAGAAGGRSARGAGTPGRAALIAAGCHRDWRGCDRPGGGGGALRGRQHAAHGR